MRVVRRALCLGPLLVLAGCGLFGPRPAWEESPPPAVDAPIVQEGKLHRYELDNGLRVLVLEDPRLPRVVLGVTLRRGEAIVDPHQAGLASFTAELMKRGAGKRGALALARAIDGIGGSLTVGADWDSMSVGVAGLSRDTDTLLDTLADVVLRPRFARAEARKARSESLAALEQAKDDPATLARWYAARAIYPGHRYGLPPSGTPGSVARLDERIARAFHGRVFLPNNAVFYAAGDVAPDALLTQVGRAFGAWQPGSIPAPGAAPPNPTPTARRILIVDRPDLGQARIVLTHEGLMRTDPERIAAALMNSAIGGGGFSSRLMEKVRSEAGLTYGVYSGFSLRRERGPFAVGTFTRVPEVRRVIDLLLAELERAKTEPPSAEELSEAQTLAIGNFSLSLETSAAVVLGLVDLDVHGLPENALDTYRARVRAVTTEDTARLARALLHPERAAIVLVGPAEALQSQVEDLGPVEVLTP